MGFYGNIKDIEKNKSFVFDKIYANRKQMDENASKDGIYTGRYVLIEYDTDASSLDSKKAYQNNNIPNFDGHKILFYGSDLSKATTIKYNNYNAIIDDNNLLLATTNGTIAYVEDKKNIYYTCVGYITVESKDVAFMVINGKTFNIDNASKLLEYFELNTQYALFDLLSESSIDSQNNYAKNYNIDIQYAKEKGFELVGHGWDSTVWQKTIVNSQDKYVMVAELNTVVPTFDLSADAPTQTPIAPHFDSNSTDVYYKLHWQPNWGIRTQLAEKDEINSKATGILEPETGTALSDSTTTWIKEYYDKATDKIKLYYYTKNKTWKQISSLNQIGEDGKLPAAVYYNKAGFDAKKRYHSSLSNDIKLDMTGYSTIPDEKNKWSRVQYNAHDSRDPYRTTEAVDTQELSMVLPGIGNAISEMWDIVYGEGDGKDDASSMRATDISWKEFPEYGKENRLQLITSKDNGNTFDYTPAQVETLAGAVNSVHDLMGMIIQDQDEAYQEVAASMDPKAKEEEKLKKFAELKADNDSIYYLQNKFYRKAPIDVFKPLENNGKGDETDGYIYKEVSLTPEKYNEWTYYIKNEDGLYVLYEGTFDPALTYYIRSVQGGMAPIEKMSTFEDIMKENSYFYKNANKDYIYENKYYKDKQYYTIEQNAFTPFAVQDGYEPDKFYYLLNDNYYLDKNTSGPTAPYEYVLKNITSRLARNIYVPGTLYSAITDNTQGGEIRLTIDHSGYDKTIKYYTMKQSDSILEIDTARKEGKKLAYRKKYKIPKTIEVEGVKRNCYLYNYIDDEGKKYSIPVWKETESKYHIIDSEDENDLVDITKGVLVQEFDYGYSNIIPTYVFINLTEEDDLNDFFVMGAINGKNCPIFYTYNPYDAAYQSANEVYIFTPIQEGSFYDEVTKEKYYKKVGDDYIKVKYDSEVPNYGSDDDTIFYILNMEQYSNDGNTAPFYQSDKYYYKVNDGKSWYFDSNGAFVKDRIYYVANEELIHSATIDTSKYYLYEPGKYYYLIHNRYYIDNNQTATPGRQYYIGKDNFYVYLDTKNVLPIYSHWNTQLPVPHNIQLATKEDSSYTMKELVGFSKTLNTIHGLILQINNFLEYGNETTRNTSTVQGTLNLLNDLITKFELLDYGQFIVTDSYGRMHTAPTVEDKWIKSYINPDVNDPEVHIHHIYNPIDDEAPTTINLNLEETKSDNIVINQPTPDATGHIVNKNKFTYVLPYGIKTIQSDEGSFTADNTQDSFSINTKDDWIKTEIAENSDVLLISHTYNPIADTESTLDLNAEGTKSDNIVINELLKDETGHIVNKNIKTITLPYGFQKINADEGSYSALNTAADFNIKTSDDNWLSTSIQNNTLSIKHENAQTATLTKGLTLNSTPKFGEHFVIPKIGIDDKGHVKDLEEFTLTLPTISLTPGTEGNVVTGISLNTVTGVFTETKAHVGNVVLGAYNATNGEIASTDTVASAIGKNAYKLNILMGEANISGSLKEEALARTTADGDLSGRIKKLEDLDINTITTGLSERISDIEKLKLQEQIDALKERLNKLENPTT